MEVKYRNIAIRPSGVNGENEVVSESIEDALHFSIENTGDAEIFIGFELNNYPLSIKPGQSREFPWVDPTCMRYRATMYIKFGDASSAMVTQLFDI